MVRSTIARISIINQYLTQNKYCSTNFLCEQVGGVSRRTLLRDIGTLLNMGAPIQYDREHNGYYYQDGIQFEMPPVKMSEGDLLTLLLTEQAIASTDSNYLYQKLKPSMEKLQLMFHQEIQVDLAQVFSFGPSHQAELSPNLIKLMEKILKAITSRKTIKIRYHSLWNGETTEREIEPYHLRFHGKWYVAGYCLLKKDYRLFTLSRIESLDVLKVVYKPRDFKIEELFGQAWGLIKGEKSKVVLEFNALTALLVRETHWHPSQQLKEQKDGSLRMTLEIDGLTEILWWILSFGSSVTVLEPAELRERLKTEVKVILEKY